MNINKKLYLIIFSGLILLLNSPVNAARFFIVPPELVVGQEQEVILGIDTEGENINAVDIKSNFSPEDFIIKSVSEGSSTISFWLDYPSFSNERGDLSFSGIIVGGYNGDDGRLLKINLIPKKVGEIEFSLSEAKILLNDGFGTEAKLNPSFLKFQIAQSGAPSEVSLPSLKDLETPEPFLPEITKHPDVFEGKWFLVFSTQDKNSGIDYYQVREARQSVFLPFTKWEKAQSPYLLKDQQLRSFVYVRAIDRAGNIRTHMLSPRSPLYWYENYDFWAIIIIIVAIILLCVKFLWKKLKKR